MTGPQISALVIADGAAGLVPIIERDGDIRVVGRVATATAAMAFVATAHPDLVVLDVHLRDGSGLQAIEQIMDRAPTPILVLSAQIADRGSPAAVEALVAGALGTLTVPAHWSPQQGGELRETIRRLSKARVIRHLRGSRSRPPIDRVESRAGCRPVVAMAASTGGPSALARVLAGLGDLHVPVLIVQHLHPDFIGGLLEWMSRVSPLPVEIARHAQVAEPGRVYLAPGRVHLRLGPRSRLELGAEPVSVHRPSADVLFTSVAEQCGPAAVGVVLTGMGADGAVGLLAIRRRGGQTLAQDEESCAVFGMPQAAQRIGAVTDLRPLSQLATAVRQAVRAAPVALI